MLANRSCYIHKNNSWSIIELQMPFQSYDHNTVEHQRKVIECNRLVSEQYDYVNCLMTKNILYMYYQKKNGNKENRRVLQKV